METSALNHMVIHVQPANQSFYKALFSFLGWKVLMEDAQSLGVMGNNHVSLWFLGPIKNAANDYDGIGMNHLAIAVSSQAAVDETVVYLQEHNIQMLFETPRNRPEWCRNEDEMYYQVMFESPDRILLEVVYAGPRAKQVFP